MTHPEPPTPEPDDTTWAIQTRRIVAVLLVVFAVYVIHVARPVLPSLIIAGLIAFILAPLIDTLRQRLRFPRGLAILVAYLVLILVILLFPLIFVPALINSFAALNIDVTQILRDTRDWLLATLTGIRTTQLAGLELDLSSIIDPAIETVRELSFASFLPSLQDILSYVPRTLEATAVFVGSVLGVVLSIVLTFIYSLYLTVDASRLNRGFWGFVPESQAAEVRQLAERIASIWNAFLRGQLTLAIIIWLVTWIGGVIIGLPGAFALGVIAGVLEIVPNLGPLLAAIPAILTAFIQGSDHLPVSNLTFTLIVIGMYVLIQQLENQIIVPKVLGEAVELPSLIILLAVVIGFQVAGVLGALIAAPTVATARELFFYGLNKVLAREPFPPRGERTRAGPSPPAWLIRALDGLRHRLSTEEEQPADQDSDRQIESK